MLSLRLWRQITEIDIRDPIFRRASQMRQRPRRRASLPRAPASLWLLATVALAALIARAPEMIALLLVVPMLMISGIVALPLLLPLLTWLAGALGALEITRSLHEEKRQRTYALLGATPAGTLGASWSLGLGVLHRGHGLSLTRWGTRLSLRLGMAALCGLAGLTLIHAAAGGDFGEAQWRLLWIPLLALAALELNLRQTFALCLLAGQWAGGLELAERDAALLGLLVYGALSLLPALAGLVALAVMGELAGLVALAGLRELGAALLWRGLGLR